MKKTLVELGIVSLAAFSALPAFADTATGGLQGLLTTIGGLIGALTPLISALALVAFFWGLAMYVLNFQGDDKDKKKGRDMMMYGILTLFVMFSVWGLVQILQNTFNISRNQSPLPVPYIIQLH